MIPANLELFLYQTSNLEFPFISKTNILKAKHVFIKNGKQTNKRLQIQTKKIIIDHHFKFKKEKLLEINTLEQINHPKPNHLFVL